MEGSHSDHRLDDVREALGQLDGWRIPQISHLKSFNAVVEIGFACILPFWYGTDHFFKFIQITQQFVFKNSF